MNTERKSGREEINTSTDQSLLEFFRVLLRNLPRAFSEALMHTPTHGFNGRAENELPRTEPPFSKPQ